MEHFSDSRLIIGGIDLVVLVDSTKIRPEVIHKNRPSYGLVYKLAGKVIYHFGDRDMDFSPESVCLLPKFSDYTVETLETGQCIAVNFQIIGDPPLSEFSGKLRGSKRIETLFRKLYGQYTAGVMNHYACFSTLYEIIDAVDTGSRYGSVSPANELKLKKVVALMNKYHSDPTLSTATLAERAGISQTAMREAFLRVYGLSPIRYLTEIRLGAARTMLIEENASVAEVARSVGFTDQFYFSRVFSRQCGVSPSEFRKKSLMNR